MASSSAEGRSSARKSHPAVTMTPLSEEIQKYLERRKNNPPERLYSQHIEAMKFATKFLTELISNNENIASQFAKLTQPDNDLMAVEYFWKNIGEKKRLENEKKANEKDLEKLTLSTGAEKIVAYEKVSQRRSLKKVGERSDTDSDSSASTGERNVNKRLGNDVETKEQKSILYTTKLTGEDIARLAGYKDEEIDEMSDEKVQTAFKEATHARDCLKECNRQINKDMNALAQRIAAGEKLKDGKFSWIPRTKQEKTWEPYWEEKW